MPEYIKRNEVIVETLSTATRRLIHVLDRVINSTDHRPLSEIINVINAAQAAFDQIKPYLPNGATPIPSAVWDRVAATRWGADNVPDGGIVAAISNAAVAGRALASAYQLRLLPLIRNDFFRVDVNSGRIGNPRALRVTPDQYATISAEMIALRDAILVVTET